MSLYRLLFVCLFVSLFVILSFCTVTDFSAGDKASGVKFCPMVHGRPWYGISHFGELCSPEAQNPTNRRAAASIVDRRQSPRLTKSVARSPSVEGTAGRLSAILALNVCGYTAVPEDERTCLFAILCLYGYGFLCRG